MNVESKNTNEAQTVTRRAQVATAEVADVPHIRQGVCTVLFAYDVGLAIRLDDAERLIAAASQRKSIRHKRRTPHYFEYQPAPLRVQRTIGPVSVGRFRTEPMVEAVIFDFGAISVAYDIPLDGSLTDLLALSDELYDNQRLYEHSRSVVQALLAGISSAVTKPQIAELVEDYVIYRFTELEPETDVPALVRDHGPLLAGILRAEPAALSRSEIDDALACQVSYTPKDRCIIDWNAALLFDPDADDVKAVLEFANVELLEQRYLDDRLDAALEQSNEAMARPKWFRTAFLGSRAADLRRIAVLQVDSALLYEGVQNALKLLGDQYLARVHRLVSQRFHLSDWDASILRKLQTIESIYTKLSDQSTNQRMEVLEWIIILLIAVSIALPFLGYPGGH